MAMMNLKGTQFPKSVILHAVCFYVRYSVFYRDLQKILAERGRYIDHALNRWGIRSSPQRAVSQSFEQSRTVLISGRNYAASSAKT
ncbi:putative transposase [Brucella grignonensis]|uniref:Putative transposase n=2 Tax=Brucella grignonensis TaxID=94627 RepID=A0A256EZA6_9HYPH|nr:putative transposase [Brucella grignonensis]